MEKKNELILWKEFFSGEEVSSLNIFCMASEKMRDAWSEEMEICGMPWKKKSDAWRFW